MVYMFVDDTDITINEQWAKKVEESVEHFKEV